MPSLALWVFYNGLLLGATYLLGSLPTGYLAGKWFQGIDLRQHGSGSTGATNVLRTLGKGPGLAVLLIDIAKGVLAIALIQGAYSQGSWLMTQVPETLAPAAWLPWMVVLGGLTAILGHSKSVWLNFAGGKSVATSLGILLMINWMVGLATLGVFAATLSISRIVSLSSIAAALALPILMVSMAQPLAYLLFAIAGGVYVIWRHWSNVQRLMAGTEPRLGQKPPVSEGTQIP